MDIYFSWNNNAGPVYNPSEDNSNTDTSIKKKQKKEHKLTDKTNKNSKKK